MVIHLAAFITLGSKFQQSIYGLKGLQDWRLLVYLRSTYSNLSGAMIIDMVQAADSCQNAQNLPPSAAEKS